MADGPMGRPDDRIAGRTLDVATRKRLLAVLKAELGRASGDVLAHGMSPEELAAQLDERIARLRAQIAELPSDDL